MYYWILSNPPHTFKAVNLDLFFSSKMCCLNQKIPQLVGKWTSNQITPPQMVGPERENSKIMIHARMVVLTPAIKNHWRISELWRNPCAVSLKQSICMYIYIYIIGKKDYSLIFCWSLDFLPHFLDPRIPPCLLKCEGGGPWSAIQASAPGRQNPQVWWVWMSFTARKPRVGDAKSPPSQLCSNQSVLKCPACVEKRLLPSALRGGVLDLVVFYRILGFGTSQLFRANVHLGQSHSNCQ